MYFGAFSPTHVSEGANVYPDETKVPDRNQVPAYCHVSVCLGMACKEKLSPALAPHCCGPEHSYTINSHTGSVCLDLF